MIRVKICGLSRELDVSFAILAGADAVGFIVGFPQSLRNITLEHAALLSRKVPPFVDSVLVTTSDVVKSEPGLKGGHFDALQLYGPVADPDEVRKLTGVRLIKPYPAVSDEAEPAKAAVKGFDAVLVDTHVDGKMGGTGIAPDWKVCRNIKYATAPTPFILSGGLKAENVGQAILAVHPFAVDVSSGVESAPSVKDPGKVLEFIKKVRESGF